MDLTWSAFLLGDADSKKASSLFLSVVNLRLVASCLFETMALLKVDFRSRGQSREADFHSTFVKKSILKSTFLDFKSGNFKYDRDSTPPRWSVPYPKPNPIWDHGVLLWKTWLPFDSKLTEVILSDNKKSDKLFYPKLLCLRLLSWELGDCLEWFELTNTYLKNSCGILLFRVGICQPGDVYG